MKKAVLQLHAAVFLWGFTGILGKLITLDAMVLVWYRMLLATLIIWILIRVKKEWLLIRGGDQLKLIAVGILFALHWVLFFMSVKLANASIAMICLALASVITALLDPLVHRTKPKLEEILISCIAVIGVVCIAFWDGDAMQDQPHFINFNAGIICGIIAAILSSVFTIINKSLSIKYPARLLVGYEMLYGWLAITVALPIYLGYHDSNITLLPNAMDWLWLLILAYCCTVWAQSLAMASLQKLNAFTVTLSVNLEPVYGIIIAFIIFQENKELGVGSYYGMGLILASLLIQIGLVLWRKKRKNKALAI